MINLRLDTSPEMMWDLVMLSQQADFPCPISTETAQLYCGADPSVQTYGSYHNGTTLVAVMSATFCRVFPHKDSPNGKMVHISGAYTHPAFRNQGYATALLRAIERDAVDFGADYICCDSTVNALYRKNGFVPAPKNETRMWKVLGQPESNHAGQNLR